MTTFKGFLSSVVTCRAWHLRTLPASSLVMPYAAEDNACSDLRLSVGGVLEWLARLLTVSRSSSGCDGAWPVAWVANGPGNRGGRAMRAQRLLEERSEPAATAAPREAWICALR